MNAENVTCGQCGMAVKNGKCVGCNKVPSECVCAAVTTPPSSK